MQPSNWALSHTCYALGRCSSDATPQVEGLGHRSDAGWNLTELDQKQPPKFRPTASSGGSPILILAR